MTDTPRVLVEKFFERMADDDRRHTIKDCFADDAVITLPGEQFQGPNATDAMLKWLAPRYERAVKEYGEWIETGNVVVSQGSLFGVNTDGEPFENVRYIDVYRIEDGLITQLDIYNDLAAEGVVK